MLLLCGCNCVSSFSSQNHSLFVINWQLLVICLCFRVYLIDIIIKSKLYVGELLYIGKECLLNAGKNHAYSSEICDFFVPLADKTDKN